MTVYIGEAGYIQLVRDVLEKGIDVPCERTGTKTKALFDAKWKVGDTFPFSTIRPAGLRLAFEEFWFFLNGKTQTKELEEKGVFFWKGNTTREFLDRRGLLLTPAGDMGRAYGAQLREYGKVSTKKPIDQLKETIKLLGLDRYSRRIYNTLWNPSESHLMALTPCWHSHQFVVLPGANGKDVLHLKVINRSLDSVFGFMFAVQQYRLYQMVLAKLMGFELGEMSCDMTHVHIYENQFEYADELISRDFGTPGTVTIAKELKTLSDVLSLEFDDIVVEGLVVNNQPFKTERPEMVA